MFPSKLGCAEWAGRRGTSWVAWQRPSEVGFMNRGDRAEPEVIGRPALNMLPGSIDRRDDLINFNSSGVAAAHQQRVFEAGLTRIERTTSDSSQHRDLRVSYRAFEGFRRDREA